MSIKNVIRSQIKDAIRRYDFEDAISSAMDEIDIEGADCTQPVRANSRRGF